MVLQKLPLLFNFHRSQSFCSRIITNTNVNSQINGCFTFTYAFSTEGFSFNLTFLTFVRTEQFLATQNKKNCNQFYLEDFELFIIDIISILEVTWNKKVLFNEEKVFSRVINKLKRIFV